jgi:glycosyltransferase involved in cell wall biosynthesis
MKILITTDLYTVSTNGVVTSVRNLMEELTKNGHEVRVLTVSEKLKSHKDDNIYYIKSLPLGVVYPDVRMPVSYRHRYLRELIDWKPDVIHSQCEYFSYQFAGYISRKTGAPIVHTYHTLYEQYATYVFPTQRMGAFFIGRLSKFRLRKADAIVAPEAGTVLWQIGGDGECVKAIAPYIGKEYKEGDMFCYIVATWGEFVTVPAALGGKLVEINAKQGTKVQKGDIIAYIERAE